MPEFIYFQDGKTTISLLLYNLGKCKKGTVEVNRRVTFKMKGQWKVRVHSL